jgi:ABC-type multidrug transport system ATPase subunit
MEIRLEKIGKRFNADWIFRNIDFVFPDNSVNVILGRNGSGKSTLLQIICGSLSPSAGKISYHHAGRTVEDHEIFQYLMLVAPYQELIEEFTLKEAIEFHFHFKPILPGYSISKAIAMLEYEKIMNKPIRQFSTGMKQRVKLILALLSDVPLLLFDEPSMNLDTSGTDWYLSRIEDLGKKRTLIICSNQHQIESNFAHHKLMIENYG